ncbi:hypothetical protein D9M68_599920 [compost metagenome]
MRIPRQHAGGICQADLLQARAGVGFPLRGRYSDVAQMLEQLLAHRQRGIQARQRLLGNERDLAAEHVAALRRRHLVQVRSTELDGAGGDAKARRQGARHHAAQHAFAGARFAYQAQHAAFGDVQVDAAQNGGGQAPAVDVYVRGQGQVAQAQ